MASGGKGPEKLGADELNSVVGGKQIFGDNVGSQTLNGTADADYIVGGSGSDTVHAGDGNDSIYGGYGDDVLYGDAGNDQIQGDFGNDTAYGGAGNDTYFWNGSGADHFDGGSGTDRITVLGKFHVILDNGTEVTADASGNYAVTGQTGRIVVGGTAMTFENVENISAAKVSSGNGPK